MTTLREKEAIRLGLGEMCNMEDHEMPHPWRRGQEACNSTEQGKAARHTLL